MSTLTKRETPALRRIFGSHPLAQLRREVEDAFGLSLGDGTFFQNDTTMVPNIDVSETEDAIHVETDLPGFKPEEVEIEVNDNYLTISGSHSEEKKEEGNGRKYHRIERRSGTFSRSVLLPCGVNEKSVDAQLKEGVLKVTLPKAEEARRRKIAVKG